MNLVKRKGQVVYEDLLRELELIEQQLMSENSGAAMGLMVLEAKLRDRFHQMELRTQPALVGGGFAREDMSVMELATLIPRDMPAFPDAPHFKTLGERTWKTVGMAALLAIGTAVGVFGLATALQVILVWLD